MPIKIGRCAKCGDPNELKTLPSVTGLDGPLQLTALEMPVLACAKKHRAPVHRDFMLWLIGEIRAECGKDLAAKSERRQAFPYELKYEELPPFKIQVEMPLYKCTGCGREQLRSTQQLHGHVAQSIMGINDAAGFPHSG